YPCQGCQESPRLAGGRPKDLVQERLVLVDTWRLNGSHTVAYGAIAAPVAVALEAAVDLPHGAPPLPGEPTVVLEHLLDVMLQKSEDRPSPRRSFELRWRLVSEDLLKRKPMDLGLTEDLPLADAIDQHAAADCLP